MRKALRYGIAMFLAFTATVEAQHFRQYQKRRNLERMAFTLTAASASLYMASEALEGNWPSWDD